MGDVSIKKELVLLGGGHSHVEVLRMFGMNPEPHVRVTLITRDIHTPYSGMLPGFVSGFYSYDECHIDLVKLTSLTNIRLIHAEASNIDVAAKTVVLPNRPAVRYDVLSIDIGIRPSFNDVDGAAQHTTPVKPIDSFVKRFDALVARVRDSTRDVAIVVVGGGAGGVELAFALQYRFSQLQNDADGQAKRGMVTVTLVSRTDVLRGQPSAAQRACRREFAAKGIRAMERATVVKVTEGALHLEDGTNVAFDECLWCTQACAAAWLRSTALPLHDDGFIAIDSTLRCAGDVGPVFAAGDVATCAEHPRPKAGVFAVRQGPPLADNLRRALRGEPLRTFVPQNTFLSLISTGHRYCIGTKGWFTFEGEWAWRWKDSIDRAFMEKYSTMLQEAMAKRMQTMAHGGTAMASGGADAMRCAGCGSKVGADVLASVIDELSPQSVVRDDVIVGIDGRDDAAVVQPPPAGHVCVQTVDFFKTPLSDPFVSGQIAAVHALSDCYAMGAEPSTAMATAVVPHAAAAVMRGDLMQLMCGALRALHDADCALVGGHTSEGADLCIGFAVYGHAPQSKLLRKSGMQPGQLLILTKALGTGCILAANMRGEAVGRWVEASVQSMLCSNKHAALCLQRHGCTAATDVTGFGLLGHLSEMAHASKVGCTLSWHAVPLLQGAADCIARGHLSTLHDANARFMNDVINADDVMQTCDAWQILVDPQTSGGLLAAVPAEHAEACVRDLQHDGYSTACVVGCVEALRSDTQHISINLKP